MMSIKTLQGLDKKILEEELNLIELEDKKHTLQIKYYGNTGNLNNVANDFRIAEKEIEKQIMLIKVNLGHLYRLYEIEKIKTLSKENMTAISQCSRFHSCSKKV